MRIGRWRARGKLVLARLVEKVARGRMRGVIKKQSDFYLIGSRGESSQMHGLSKNASGKKAFDGIKDDKLGVWQNTLAKSRGQNLADIF